jgi:hypothetical protein
MYIMALGFLGAGSKSAEQEKLDTIAYNKKVIAEKKASVEKNKKQKKMLQGGLGKTLGGGVAKAFSFGSKAEGGIMGSLGLGQKQKFKIPAMFAGLPSTRPVMTTKPYKPSPQMLKISEVIGTQKPM